MKFNDLSALSICTVVLLVVNNASHGHAFVVPNEAGARMTRPRSVLHESSSSSSSNSNNSNESGESVVTKTLDVITEVVKDVAKDREIARQKEKLLGLLAVKEPKLEKRKDPILADPLTKESLTISAAKSSTKVLLGGNIRSRSSSSGGGKRRNGGGGGGSGINVQLQSDSNTYTGNTQSFYDLLEPVKKDTETNDQDSSARALIREALVRNLVPFIPPPLRAVAAATGMDEYVPMRDLFTSPAVSFAYERGWRQNFQQAGFPGPDKEAKMAMDFFQPAFDNESDKDKGVLVDMSCATGLFTRRFAKSGRYNRVLGCDYSASMLAEARRRIQADDELSSMSSSSRRLELIRCDVGQIPLQDDSITALHAGAAMHCWPDLPRAVSEIYRVLKPGGRYYASTFLSNYFRFLSGGNSDNNNIMGGPPSQEAFQYFESTDQLRSLMESAGFSPDKVSIEVLGRACVVIRCEK